MKYLGDPKSGSQAGTTASRNRNGQYLRTRANPVQPRTVAQLDARSRQSTNAAAWRALTGTQRAGWTSLGMSMSRTDSLGQAYTLTGAQAFCSINNILAAVGSALLSDPPAMVTPSGLLTASLTATSGGSPVLSFIYTATPLAAGVKLVIRCSPPRSAGRNFESDYRIISVTAAAAASPANILTAYTAKFGPLVSGTRINFSAATSISGFESVPFPGSVIVT